MGKADDMRKQREAQHAQQQRAARGVAPVEAGEPDPDVEALIAEGAADDDAVDPVAAEGKCAVCRKVKAVQGGVVVSHQKGLGKMCPGSRKPPA